MGVRQRGVMEGRRRTLRAASLQNGGTAAAAPGVTGPRSHAGKKNEKHWSDLLHLYLTLTGSLPPIAGWASFSQYRLSKGRGTETPKYI